MQSIFTKCIFCRQPLPEKPEDCAEEHVIPKSVGGSLVIRDVCQSCNSKLGAEVDHLIFHDARIIDAINKLDLLEMRDQVAKIGKTTGIDTVSGAIVEGMVVSGKPKLVTREIEPEGIGVPEEKAKAILIKQVQRDGRLNWSKEKAAQHIEEIVWPKYKKMSFGTEQNFPEIGRKLRRGQVGNFTTDWKDTKLPKNAGHRLVAKIIFEICHYALDWPTLQVVRDDLNWYGAFAYGEKQEEEGRIMLRTPIVKYKPDYHHLIQILFYERFIAVDVDFFQSVNFRGVLFPKAKFEQPIFDGQEVEGIGIAMTFKPDTPKKKFTAFRFKSSHEWVTYRVPGL